MAVPPAGGVPLRPATRHAGGGARRQPQRPLRVAVQIAPPRRGCRAATLPCSPRGGSARAAKRTDASPEGALRRGGECGARAERHSLRRRRGCAGEAGRSAADPDRRGGQPQPPQSGGGWAPRSTYAATGAGEEQCKPAPQGRLSWACIAEGLPCATAGGWQAPQVRRPEPPPTLRSSCRRRRLGGGDQPPHAPDCRRQAGRAAAPPPPRVGRGTPRRARGREGRPRLQAGVDGSPLSPLSGRSEAIRDPPACKAGGSRADQRTAGGGPVRAHTCPRPHWAKSHVLDR